MNHARGLSPLLAARIAAGEEAALLQALLAYARSWVESAGSRLEHREAISCVHVAADLRPKYSAGSTPEQRALLAAGCDLFDLLAATPQGRKAIADFLGNPVFQETKGE